MNQDTVLKIPNQLPKRIFMLLAGLLYVYVAYKAYAVGFTHDESVSYTLLTGDRGWLFTTNNHWINTCLSFVTTRLGGFEEWVIRLPNVLVFGGYIWAIYRLGFEGVKNKWSLFFALPFLLLNPFVLQYFSMARGYGLVMTFSAVSLYYLLQSLEQKAVGNLWKVTFWATLAIYANYAFLIWFFALYALYFIRRLSNRKMLAQERKKLLFVGLVQILATIPALGNLYLIHSLSYPLSGGSSNIVTDTLMTVLNHTFSYQILPYQNACLLMGVVLAGGLFMLAREKNYTEKENNLILKVNKILEKWILLLGTSVILLVLPTLLNVLFEVPYATERTAMYWVFIFGLVVLWLADWGLENWQNQWTGKGIVLILFVMTLFNYLNFVATTQLDYYQTNQSEADLKTMLHQLGEEADTTKTVHLGIDWTFEPTINYYRETMPLNWLAPVHRKGFQGEYDFFYLRTKLLPQLPPNCELVQRFETSETQLFKAKKR